MFFLNLLFPLTFLRLSFSKKLYYSTLLSNTITVILTVVSFGSSMVFSLESVILVASSAAVSTVILLMALVASLLSDRGDIKDDTYIMLFMFIMSMVSVCMSLHVNKNLFGFIAEILPLLGMASGLLLMTGIVVAWLVATCIGFYDHMRSGYPERVFDRRFKGGQ